MMVVVQDGLMLICGGILYLVIVVVLLALLRMLCVRLLALCCIRDLGVRLRLLHMQVIIIIGLNRLKI